MKYTGMIVLAIAPNVALADAYLVCDFGTRKDFISLANEEVGRYGPSYSTGTYQFDYGPPSNIKFDDASGCSLNCVGPDRYVMFTYQVLNRKTLELTDRLPLVTGQPVRTAQCAVVDRPTWDAEIERAKSTEGNQL